MKKLDFNRLIGNVKFPSIRLYRYNGALKEICQSKILRTFVLCLIESGEGSIIINGTIHSFRKGDMILLSPNTTIENCSASTNDVQLTMILFSCIQLNRDARGWNITTPNCLDTEIIQLSNNHAGIYEIMDQFIACYKEREEECNVTIPYMLSRLLLKVLKLNSSIEEQHKGDTNGMEMVIDYMNKTFLKDIKINDLAGMAGFSVNHFTKVFKRIMNKTPMDYLMELRMTRAKQLLTSNDKMKHIARKSGFRDEHYFSRAFKKIEGVAPTLYIKNKCHRIATLYYGLDDHLITLGVKPIAFLSYEERLGKPSSLYQSNQRRMQLSSFQPNYDRLMKMKPDLMLTSDRLNQEEAIKRIAPTAVLGHSNFSGNMLAHIGDLLGKEREAANWLEEYGQHKETLKSQIWMRWGKQSAYFIRVSSQFLRVYGKTNQTGNLIYEDLGLLIPSHFPEDRWAVDIQLHELQQYESDHIFLMVDPTEQARNRLSELIHSEQWQALRAVQQQQVYNASDLMFEALGSSSRMLAMKRIAAQLGI